MFKLAAADDAEELVGLRDDVARWLLGRGIKQWLPGEFSQQRMRSWIQQGYVHVCRRDDVIAAAVAVLEDDPDIWSDGRRDAGYIHLLMVDRAHAGAGLGDAALAHAEEMIRDAGGRFARLDAVASNVRMQDWYEQRGYRSVGTKAYEGDDLFDSVLLEKPLV